MTIQDYVDIATYVTEKVIEQCEHKYLIEDVYTQVYDATEDSPNGKDNMVILTTIEIELTEEKVNVLKLVVSDGGILIPSLDEILEELNENMEQANKRYNRAMEYEVQG